MWTLTMCCFRLKLFEKVFQQYSQTRGCIHLHRFRGCVAWEVFVVAVSEFEPSPSWFGNDAWIFSICWAETGRKLETVFIHNFYLSAREPSRPCPASSVLVQDDGEMMVEMDLNVIIGPESDHWECLSLTHWLTNSLTNWLLFSKLDWCDPGVWRCQLKTCWGCYCC